MSWPLELFMRLQMFFYAIDTFTLYYSIVNSEMYRWPFIDFVREKNGETKNGESFVWSIRNENQYERGKRENWFELVHEKVFDDNTEKSKWCSKLFCYHLHISNTYITHRLILNVECGSIFQFLVARVFSFFYRSISVSLYFFRIINSWLLVNLKFKWQDQMMTSNME